MFRDTLSKIFNVDNFVKNLQGYVESRVELLKIEAKEEVAKGMAYAVLYLCMAFVFALFITFLSIAVALVLATLWGNFAGFSIVGGVWLIVGVILWFSRDALLLKLERRFTHIMKKKKE